MPGRGGGEQGRLGDVVSGKEHHIPRTLLLCWRMGRTENEQSHVHVHAHIQALLYIGGKKNVLRDSNLPLPGT